MAWLGILLLLLLLSTWIRKNHAINRVWIHLFLPPMPEKKNHLVWAGIESRSSCVILFQCSVKFCHFGYFLWALAKFFFRKVAKENGEIFGYFLKWAEFLVFNAINHFSNGKNGQFWTFLVKYFNCWAIFKLEISGSFLLWAITWAINKGPKHHKMA